MLKNPGGRAAVIVPDGVLFGSSNAHVALRKLLVEENQLEAVIKLPAGVFRPYAGVATAFLIFARGGRTDHVFYYDVQADGFSLDDKRDPVDDNDLPDVCIQWNKWDQGVGHEGFADRTAKAFSVSADDIRMADYDLSINRHKDQVHEDITHDHLCNIIRRMPVRWRPRSLTI